jgi:hypothetical protein
LLLVDEPHRRRLVATSGPRTDADRIGADRFCAARTSATPIGAAGVVELLVHQPGEVVLLG